MSRRTVGESYSDAGSNLLSGRYRVPNDELPELAKHSANLEDDPLMTHAELARYHFPLPDQYERLAWWTYQAFIDHAGTAEQPVDLFSNPFEQNGAGFIGMFEMAEYLAIITNVYHKQAQQPETEAERLHDIRSIAMRSSHPLQVIAAESIPVATEIEKKLLLQDFGGRSAQGFYDECNSLYQLIEGEGGPHVTTRVLIEGTVNEVSAKYQELIAAQGLPPARRVGCLAMRLSATPDMNVFDAMWHGVVLAGTSPDIVGKHLQQLDRLAN